VCKPCCVPFNKHNTFFSFARAHNILSRKFGIIVSANFSCFSIFVACEFTHVKAKHNSKPTVTTHGLSEAVKSIPLHVCQKNRHHFTALPTHYTIKCNNYLKKAKKASKQVRFHDKTTVKQKIIQDSNLQGQNSPFHGTVFQ
jgi:hypothetical protein